MFFIAILNQYFLFFVVFKFLNMALHIIVKLKINIIFFWASIIGLIIQKYPNLNIKLDIKILEFK